MTQREKKYIDEIAQLRFIGSQMSNVCCRIAFMTEVVTKDNKSTMAELVRKWDAIPRAKP